MLRPPFLLFALLFYVVCTALAFAQGEHPESPAKQAEHNALLNLKADLAALGITDVMEIGDGESVTITENLTIDTIIILPGGELTVEPGVVVTIMDNGPVADPMKMSRGIINHGTLIMRGTFKERRARVAFDPMAGDSSIMLAVEQPTWAVGDRIVIAGTRRYKDQSPEDEIRIISAIDGAVVSFDEPLAYNHDAPRDDLKTWVGNYSSDTAVVGPEGVPNSHRPSVNCMHSKTCDVQNVAIVNAGRTDKSMDLSASNPRGNYPLHCHRNMPEPADDTAPEGCIFLNNAIWTSPGWGIVHHDSHAVINGNAVYGAFGAGIVAESGNETGVWRDNLVIWSEGIAWKSPKNVDTGDPDFNLGRSGDGYWHQGRLLESTGNVAASVNTGFVFAHRGITGDGFFMKIDAATFRFPEALHHDEDNDPNGAPILIFDQNEAFAAREGLLVFKANPSQGHDIHSLINRFTAWRVGTGIDLQYTAHYTVRNPLLVAGEDDQLNGITLGNNLYDVTVVEPVIQGFPTSIVAAKTSTFPAPADWGIRLVGGTMDGVVTNFEASDIVAELGTGFDVALDPLTYHDRNDGSFDSRSIWITGVKHDSVGIQSYPGGADQYRAKFHDVLRLLARYGWYSMGDKRVMVLPWHSTDRGTGDVYMAEYVVEIDSGVKLGSYTHLGELDPNGLQPLTLVHSSSDPAPPPDPEPDPDPAPDPEPDPTPEPDPEPEPDLQAQLDEANATIALLQQTIAEKDAAFLILSNSLTAEQDAHAETQEALAGAQVQLDAAIQSLAAVEAERDALAVERASLISTNAVLAAEVAQMTTEIADLKSVRDDLIAANVAAAASLSSIEAAASAAKAALEAFQ